MKKALTLLLLSLFLLQPPISAFASTTLYGYDFNNDRVTKGNGTATTTYANKYYNVFGATTTKHIYDNSGLLIATVEGNGTATSTKYVHADHLGSTNVVTDEQGVVVEAVDYYPYGSQRINTGTFTEQRKFTGHEFDTEANLTYAKARYYDQDAGKFLSIDPASRDNPIQFLADPQQLQSYSYARNNPLLLVDRTGNYIETAFDIAMLGLSLNDFRQNPSIGNAFGVIADAAGVALPVPAFVGGIRHADDAAKFFAKGVEKVGEAGKAVNKLPDSALVCRGGSCTAGQFKAGKGVTLDNAGKLEGVSVNSAPNVSLQELTKSLPHSQVGVTSVGDVRKMGGNVVPSSRLNGSNPYHSTLQGVTPQQAEQLFRPTIHNPNK